MKKSPLFQRCMIFTRREEGGFVDNPRDPGGVTGAGGVTLRAVKLRDHDKDGRLDFDVDKDGDVDRDDMRALDATDPRVEDFYLQDYWTLAMNPTQPVTCDAFTSRMALAVFDMSINSGPRAAITILQRSLGLVADGVVGQKTILAARRQDALPFYIAERAVFMARQEAKQYLQIGDRAPVGPPEKFASGELGPMLLRGWFRRLLRLHAECLLIEAMDPLDLAQ